MKSPQSLFEGSRLPSFEVSPLEKSLFEALSLRSQNVLNSYN
jgi:hypothetical protein